MLSKQGKTTGPIKASVRATRRDILLMGAVCLLWMAMGLFIAASSVQAARIAGEEGVKPASPEVSEPPGTVPEQKPAQAVSPPKAAAAGDEKASPGTAQTVSGAPQREAAEKRYVTIDFDNVDIQLFIKFISELTGKNFIVDKGVQGKVTIVSPTKISVEEAYRVFESVLEVYGFTTVPSGSVIKIVPAIAARAKSIETSLLEEALDAEDNIVTQLIPLRYANPDELKKLFAPLISKSSVIVSYPPTGMLIVTDVHSNIKRLMKIVNVIDVMGIGEEISVVPLEHATASVLAKSLTSVFQPTRTRTRKDAAGDPGIRIIADDRTNALIIGASEADTIKVKQLIGLLDRRIPRGEGDIRVYYLQNARAEDLATVLMALPTGEFKAAPAAAGKAPVISKEVQIVADKATNSLVITANRDDYLLLEAVIEKLDIPRRMVFLEALLMEVSVDKSFDLGVQWLWGDDIGSYEGREIVGFGASTPTTGNLLPSPGASGTFGPPAGFSLGVVGEAIEIGGVRFPSLGAVVRAMKTDSDVQIISTPQIMTMDNEEAEIVIAENIPYLTRQETSESGLDYSNYEFKDVGVTLKITPQINQERFVRLQIFQEVAQVVKQEDVGLPTTLKRQAQTTVTIKDGNTIVIAGLIDETLTQGGYTVPCLGDIPVLGWAFRTRANTQGRTNLYFFVTPRIVENPAEARVVYEQKKEEIDKIQESAIKMYDRPGRMDEELVEGASEMRHETERLEGSDIPSE